MKPEAKSTGVAHMRAGAVWRGSNVAAEAA